MLIYWIVYFGTKFLSFLFFPVEVIGRENIPREGAFLLASNHVSYLDPMVMGIVTGRRINFMAKDELFLNPILGYILKKLWAFPIKRNTADKKALRECLHRISQGLPVLLFPEGTRHGNPGEKKIEAGVGFLALKANVPVVPVYIDGSQKVLPPGSRFPRRNKVYVRYGPAMTFSPGDDYQSIAQAVMDAIWRLRQ